MLRGRKMIADLYILKPESDIKCHYCDSLATHQLAERNVCSDCLKVIKDKLIIDHYNYQGVLENEK